MKKILLTLALLAVVVVIAWVVFLPGLVKGQITSRSGFPTDASTISVNPFSARVLIEDFHVRNPAEFPNPAFVDLKKFDVAMKPFSFMGDRLEIPHAYLEIEKITVVTNKEGVSNASLFNQRVQGPPSKDGKPAPQPKGGEKPAKPFHIGELIVRIGTVETIDYSKGDQPVVNTIKLGVDRTFKDVTDPKVIVGPLATDIARANVGGLSNVLAGMLPGEYSAAFNGALQDLGLGGSAGEAAETVKKLFDSMRGTAKP